jgi:Mannosyltransferase (PIG-V)
VNLGDWARRILLPFAATRVGLLLVGVLALGLIGPAPGRSGNLVAHAPESAPLEVWARWDSEWYLLIAAHGYRVDSFLQGYRPDYRPEDSTGFFPLYPLLLRAASTTGLPPVAAGVLVSNVALLVALTLFHRLVRDEMDEPSATFSVWALLAFPTSLFLSAVYTESLALALTLGAFLAARNRRWGTLAVCGFLGALTRPTGVLVAAAIAWEVWERKGGWKAWLSLAAFPAGTGVFCLFCQRAFGDPLAWVHRQARWRGAVSGPWRAFVRFFESAPRLHGSHSSIVELVIAALFLVALVPAVRRLRPAWAAYAVLSVLVPLCSTLWSFSRLALAIFPVFALIGLAAKNRPGLLALYLAVSLPLGGFLMALFACGGWAG